jgi:hypothetical protein
VRKQERENRIELRENQNMGKGKRIEKIGKSREREICG